MTKHVLLLVCLFFAGTLHAQEKIAAHTDVAKHNIKRATTLALLPGAGQAYNRKYWKIPLVWGAIGGSTYYCVDLNSDFNSYKKVLTYIIDHPDLTTRVALEASAPGLFLAVPNPFFQSTSNGVAQETIGFMEALRTQREYAFFGILGIYVLSILDANIDAHLYDFDVSDDLSVSPKIQTYHGPSTGRWASPGLSLTYTFP